MSNTKGKDDGNGQTTGRPQRSPLQLRRRKKAGTGAVLLSLLTVVFILFSYRTGNLLFEFDSIVSFLAALVLLFRDTTHTVQARVVNRILTSSHQLVADLSAYGLGGASYLYVPEGRKVGDVMLVPQEPGEIALPNPPSDKVEGEVPTFLLKSANSVPTEVGGPESRSAETTQSGSGDIASVEDNRESNPLETSKNTLTTTISNLKFAPPGRAMAELFLRESALRDPTLDDIIAAIPETIVSGFQLAESISVSVGPSDETVEVKLIHPVLTADCGVTKPEGAGIIGCEVCSMLAVLLSSSTGRLVSLRGCIRDELNDSSTTSLRLGAKFPAD